MRCPVCDSKTLFPLFQKKSMPKYNLEKHYTRESALKAKTGGLDFQCCRDCSFVFNGIFDPREMDYQVEYESSRQHSNYFNSFLDRICRDLDAVFPLEGKNVLEVGCGDGAFLNHLASLFSLKGFGFDPNANGVSGRNVQMFKSYFNAKESSLKPDVVVLRHILEHQKNPYGFLQNIIGSESDLNLYVEVPDWEWIADNNSIFAFSHEHCSYYSRLSMQRMFSKVNCVPQKINYAFEKEYLQFYGIRSFSAFESIAEGGASLAKSEKFSKDIPLIFETVRDLFHEIASDSVLWGAAGKGTTLLNLFDLDDQKLEHVIDSNPLRHNTYIPCTGQKISGPEILAALKPKYVLVTNSSYLGEIRDSIARTLSGPCQIVALDNPLHISKQDV